MSKVIPFHRGGDDPAKCLSCRKSFLPIFNGIVLILYITHYDIASRFLLGISYIALFSSLLSFFSIRSSARMARYLSNSQIALFGVILCFFLCEFISVFIPQFIPLPIRNYLASGGVGEEQVKKVEYLDESPFVRFKPNMVVRSQGYRGTSDQFVYEWTTDGLGFKNPAHMANQDQVDIVVVGNSFTEGMGVAVDKIWPTLLTSRGYPTYNLAVQGYAPTQMEGSLRQFGLRFKPKYIVIAYCATTYRREKAFLDHEYAIKNKAFTGGIQSIVRAEVAGEIRDQAKYFVSAVYLLLRSEVLNRFTFGYGINLKDKKNLRIVVKQLQPYRRSILKVGHEVAMMDQLEFGSSREWNSTLSAFRSIISMGQAIGAKIILMYLPHREPIYFKKATGTDLPDRHIEKVEAALLEQFSRENNIIFLNPSNRMQAYVEQLPDDAPITEYPYLPIDGHLSVRGHELVAEEMKNYLDADGFHVR